MASSSRLKWRYDVFLSFRGEDTRTNFVSHLFTALHDRGINTFKDDHSLKRGKSLSPELLEAIEQSRFALVVFSRNYANSSWCLDELAKIVDCKNSSIGQTVLPVFYYVDPSDVRKQKGYFEEAFNKYEINGDKDQIQRWKKALAEVASISGWALPNTTTGDEANCIKQIVGNIWTSLRYTRASSFVQNLIGMESRVQNVKSLLFTGSDEVQVLGISGMGGVGKTTLARAVFEDISNQFEGRCFVDNVRDTPNKTSLQSLQEKILSEILMDRELKVPSVHEGIIMMSRLCHTKALVVLDDVDNVDQLNALAGKRHWFGKGSIIIITTRDEHLLVVHEVNKIHKAVLLDDDEALLLFNKYAFKGKSHTEEFVELSRLVVRDVGRLPLALKVLGSFLYGRTIAEWKGVVGRLFKHAANNEILRILKISFDGLGHCEQEIFLDIACFFAEWKKDYVSEVLASFGFDPDIGLSILIEKSILNISNGTLQMHDLMIELARDIVYQKDTKEPGRRSRLWLPEDALAVMTDDTGTEAIECINLHITETMHITSFRALRKMTKLRLLDIRYLNGNVDKEVFGPEDLSNELCWIRWDRYPSKSLPESFQPAKLVCLDMPSSNMVQLWRGKKILDKLKYVDLRDSTSLTGTPDMSGAPNLVRLCLRNCTKLKQIHASLGSLPRLIVLDLYGCINLTRFSSSFNMPSLEFLNLSSCVKLKVFPQIEGDMKKLAKLYMNGTAIKEVHPSIGKLTGLVILDLFICKKLRCLPSTIGCLKSLKKLDLTYCSGLKKLPDTLGQMESLEELLLSWSGIRQVPSSVLQLKDLKTLTFGGPSLLYLLFPSLTSVGRSANYLLEQSLSGFPYLKKLELVYCNLSEIPSNLLIQWLPILEDLSLEGNKFTCLPDNLCQFARLKVLNLSLCDELTTLVELPPSIEKLCMDNCSSLENVGDLLTRKYKWLHDLSFRNCVRLEEHLSCNNSNSGLPDMLIHTMLQVTDSLCQFARLELTKLVELRPLSIETFNMDNRRSLENVGDLLTTIYKSFGKYCSRLVEHLSCNNSNSGLPDMLIHTMLQGQAVVNHKFSLLIPGKEIPNWISRQVEMNYQKKEDATKENIGLKFFADCDRRIAGFAICCVLVLDSPQGINITLGDGNNRNTMQLRSPDGFYLPLESDHVWVGYISLDLFGRQFIGDQYSNQDDWNEITRERFFQIKPMDTKRRITKFGIRIVYMDEIKQMNEEEEDRNNSFTESSWHLKFDPTECILWPFYCM